MTETKLHGFFINGSGGNCCYLQAVMEAVIQIQVFTTNDSDGVSDGGYICLHAVVVYIK